jgi:hypothetical protein
MSQEKPGQMLQATALVHEAYMRLVDVEKVQYWHSRGHFFGAAAEAMRRTLIENAWGKTRRKDWTRVDFEELDLVSGTTPEQLLAIDEALGRLQLLEKMSPRGFDAIASGRRTRA